MEIKEVTDKGQWTDFVIDFGPGSGAFLQSWEWGEFEKEGGNNIHRYGFYEAGALLGVCQVNIKRLPFGQNYAVATRGPIFNDGYQKEMVVEFANFLKDEYKVFFFRFEPTNDTAEKIDHDKNIKVSASVSPKQTLITDLAGSESALMAGMHSKTRYNIRLAERKGIKIEHLGPEGFEEAWKVFSETSERDQFKLHGKNHYERMVSLFPEGNVVVRLVGARYEEKLVAVNIMVDFSNTRTYLHGASSNQYRNVMAPYALHWHELSDAREETLDYYDWWGISEENPAWAGITRFKRGFGGKEIEYPGTFDFILDKSKYRFYSLARKVLYGKRR